MYFGFGGCVFFLNSGVLDKYTQKKMPQSQEENTSLQRKKRKKEKKKSQPNSTMAAQQNPSWRREKKGKDISSAARRGGGEGSSHPFTLPADLRALQRPRVSARPGCTRAGGRGVTQVPNVGKQTPRPLRWLPEGSKPNSSSVRKVLGIC